VYQIFRVSSKIEFVLTNKCATELEFKERRQNLKNIGGSGVGDYTHGEGEGAFFFLRRILSTF
jgi:hypothetical protein